MITITYLLSNGGLPVPAGPAHQVQPSRGSGDLVVLIAKPYGASPPTYDTTITAEQAPTISGPWVPLQGASPVLVPLTDNQPGAVVQPVSWSMPWIRANSSGLAQAPEVQVLLVQPGGVEVH